MKRIIDKMLINNHPDYFFKYKNGKPYPYLKEDIKNEINPFIPNTFLWIMKDLDIPYFENEWLHLIIKMLENNKDIRHVIGKYINKMELMSFKNFTFEDSCYSKNIYNYLEPIKEKINHLRLGENLNEISS